MGFDHELAPVHGRTTIIAMAERTSTTVQYLRVIGRLYADLQLKLRPGYLTEFAPTVESEGAGDGLLEAQLFDAENALIAKYPLRLDDVCAQGGTGRPRAVRGWIPFHPRTRTVRYTYRGRVLQETVRADAGPEVRLTWQPPARVKGTRRITWRARAADSTTAQFFLRYSHTAGKTWHRIGLRTSGNACEVDFDQLPGGDRCQLALVATDGINTAVVESPPFAVPLKPCQAMILAPVDGSSVRRGERVQFIGQGFWLEEGHVEKQMLEWVSSIDGSLGCGPTLEAASLSLGEHRITLRAGAEPRQGSQSMIVRVTENSGHPESTKENCD